MLRFVAAFLCLSVCCAQYSVPEITVEALIPRGFRAYIPDTPGLQMFIFNGKINESLSNTQPGDFVGDISKPTNGFWLYRNPNIQLKVGDTIYYWVFIQHNRLGYRKDDLQFEVKELVQEKELECIKSLTLVNGGANSCKGTLVFEDLFHNLDNGKWELERYNPSKGPNYEFNYYEKDTISVTDSHLNIQPVAKQNEDELRGNLDLEKGCTSPYHEECRFESQHFLLLPPVKSGRITSRSTFKYGKIEVRAKLPVGDWLFTEIGFVPKDKKDRETKIWVAYTRGNENLKDSVGNELGGRVLYCGPIKSSTETKRNTNLSQKKGGAPYSSDFHTYALLWLPTEITCSVDDVQVGKIITTTGFKELDTEFHISVGIGVGGNNDFPNELSPENPKPWLNRDSKIVRTFFDAKHLWEPTWKGDDYTLKVDSIKIHAV